jgi:hypothetical protein
VFIATALFMSVVGCALMDTTKEDDDEEEN